MEPLHQRLDREAEEKGYWTRPRAEVRNVLVEHYAPFAEQLAQTRASKNKRADKEDCEQEAYIALIGAVEAFDPGKGVQFTTFAYTRVCGGTVEAERKNDWVGHKVRSEHDDTLPLMGHFKDGFGELRPEEPEDDEDGAATIAERIIKRANPKAAELLSDFVTLDGDIEACARSAGMPPDLYQEAFKAACCSVLNFHAVEGVSFDKGHVREIMDAFEKRVETKNLYVKSIANTQKEAA